MFRMSGRMWVLVFVVLILGVTAFGVMNPEQQGTVMSFPRYVDLTGEGQIKNADLIVIGQVTTKGERIEAVRLDDEDGDNVLYANVFTVEVREVLKGKSDLDALTLQVMEDQDYGMKSGDEILVIAAEIGDEQVYVPVAGAFGLFHIENGIVKGMFAGTGLDYRPLDAVKAEIRNTLYAR